MRRSPLSLIQATQAERLLNWILCYPLCSGSQLALWTGMDPSRVYRLLKLMEEWGDIEWCVSASLGKQARRLYYLSSAGLDLLADLTGERAATLASRWRCRDQDLLALIPRLPHLLLVETFLQGLLSYAPAMLADAATGRHVRVNWHWQRDATRHFLFHQHAHRCDADAFVMWRAQPQETTEISTMLFSPQDRWWGAFLLVDGGLLPPSLIRERLLAFLRYRVSPEWTSSLSAFPPLIIVTTTWHRAELWHRSYTAVQDRVAGDNPLTAVITLFNSSSSLSASFNPWLPGRCRTLATGLPCTLRQVLVPLNQRALAPELFAHLQQVQALQHARRTTTLFRVLQHSDDITAKETGRPRMDPVLVGGYQQRARDFFSHRPPVSLAEQLAFLSLVLGQRQREVLTLLYTFPLLSTNELAELTHLQPQSALRYVRELQRFGCVQSHVDQKRNLRWSVDTQGVRLLAATHHLSASQHLASSVPANPSRHDPVSPQDPALLLLPKGLPQALQQQTRLMSIYHFLVLLHRQVQVQSGYLDWWVSDASCERIFQHAERPFQVRPDVEFQFRASDGRTTRCWLHWEPGLTQGSSITRKLQAYHHYARSRAWVSESALPLPFLLFLVPDKRQENVFIQFLRKECLQSGFLVRTTTQTRLDRGGGPLATIWRNPFQEDAQAPKAHLPFP